jgi:hypothetical protein
MNKDQTNKPHTMIRNLLVCLFVLLCLQTGAAQSITGKIIDSETGESLSFANIQINGKESVVSNAEGNFTVPQKYSDDSSLLNISFLGYKNVNISLRELKAINFIVKLQPGVFEMETVYISNTNFKNNPDSIMVNVKRNLARNYKSTTKPAKNMVFYREGTSFKPVKLNVEMTKSTGYKKRDLKGSNAELKAFTSNLISHPPQQFTDILCNYYTAQKTINDKSFTHSKLEVVKAVKLKDKNRSVDFKELQQKASEIVFKHLDTTKYYRIKSGLFGTRDTVLHGNSFNSKKERENNAKKSAIKTAKNDVTSFMTSSSLLYNSKFDFINKQELYEYVYAGATQSDKDEWVYVINFKPRKSAAKYAGTLYVAEKDFAVVRVDYTLGEGKKLGGVNLKFLLGIKQSENVSSGTVIYKERVGEPGYYLHYASEETGSYIYINRPLKFIEMTDGEKDQVAFDIKLEANMLDKEEYFVMSSSEIAESVFDAAQEAEFNYIHLDSYDPNTWKEYSTIAPLEEMKQFRSVE